MKPFKQQDKFIAKEETEENEDQTFPLVTAKGHLINPQKALFYATESNKEKTMTRKRRHCSANDLGDFRYATDAVNGQKMYVCLARELPL